MPEMLTQDRVRPIKREDENKLKTLLGLKDTDDLPGRIVDCYWQHARLWQRLGYQGLSDELLVSVLIHGHATAPPPSHVPWIVDAVADKKVKRDSMLKVSLAGTERRARFISLTAGKDRARVHVDGDGDERTVPVQDVLGLFE